jgi:hypothetical protein
MEVSTQQRKKRNSPKINLIISAVFHAVILGGLLYFAARQGLLGKQIKKIAVEMVKKEKKPEEKKKEPEKPKEVTPKPETPKTEVAKVIAPKEPTAPPPAAAMAPDAAPPPASLGALDFDGGRIVETTSDPVKLYKGLVEYALKFNWERPQDMDDHTNVAEIEVAVDKAGHITSPVWKKTSGQKQWDDSVRKALANTTKISRPPPSNFPPRVVVRFDVEEMQAVQP